MANEGVIKVQYAVASSVTVTAKILKPDDTVRDAQTAVALDDTGHANLYTNTGAITIQPGDSIVVYDGAVNKGADEYRPETRAVSLRTTVATIPVADSSITLTDGSADDDVYIGMVLSITQAASGVTSSRRITSYTGGTLRADLNSDFEFAITAGDAVVIWADTYSQTATSELIDDIVVAIDEILPNPNRFAK